MSHGAALRGIILVHSSRLVVQGIRLAGSRFDRRLSRKLTGVQEVMFRTRSFQAEDKRVALEDTKNYATQALASVAYQINAFSYHLLQLFDHQDVQLAETESDVRQVNQVRHLLRLCYISVQLILTNGSKKYVEGSGSVVGGRWFYDGGSVSFSVLMSYD